MNGTTMKPPAHPTKWTLVITSGLPSGKSWHRVHDYDTQSEAEAEFEKALERGEWAYILPPLAALASKGGSQ